MRRAISLKIRLLVAQRANSFCEYCHFHENDRFLAFEIDHIISVNTEEEMR